MTYDSIFSPEHPNASMPSITVFASKLAKLYVKKDFVALACYPNEVPSELFDERACKRYLEENSKTIGIGHSMESATQDLKVKLGFSVNELAEYFDKFIYQEPKAQGSSAYNTRRGFHAPTIDPRELSKELYEKAGIDLPLASESSPREMASSGMPSLPKDAPMTSSLVQSPDRFDNGIVNVTPIVRSSSENFGEQPLY